MTLDEPKPLALPAEPSCFFQSVDWWSFGLTTFLVFMVYLFTLAPEASLRDSGVYIIDAMYLGPSNPPEQSTYPSVSLGLAIQSGHPVWAIYGWLFTKLVPFSNVAWRVNLSSAVAGALTCGLIALMVSRVGFMAVENLPSCKNLFPREQSSLRMVCGSVAGLGFGLDGGFWPKAVVADPWPLSLLLFSLALCLVTRWFFMPAKKFPLYLATFISGLMVVESQTLIPVALGLLFMVVMGGRQLGRDVLLFASICLWVLFWRPTVLGWFDFEWDIYDYDQIMLFSAILTTLACAALCWSTRGFFGEWKTLAIGIILFLAGISFIFLLPVFSMADPPVNLGYSRTVEDFFRSARRGQYGYIDPAPGFQPWMQGWEIFSKSAWDKLGSIYLFAAAIPLLALRKSAGPARRWLMSFPVVCFFTGQLMIMMLNLANIFPGIVDLDETYFTVVHLLLAVLSGCGFMIVGAIFGRPVAVQSPEPVLRQN